MIVVEFQKLHFVIAFWTLQWVISEGKEDKGTPFIEIQEDPVLGPVYGSVEGFIYFTVARI